jgi:hypothetical protein
LSEVARLLLWQASEAASGEKKKTDASQRGGGLRPSHSGTCRLEMPLGCLSGSRGKNADPLGKRDKFRQGLDLHFLHHLVAMGLRASW